MAKQNNGKVDRLEFILKAIRTLRKGESRGIHVVYSGFNSAFMSYYGEAARETVDTLVKEGKIAFRPCKGGIMIYLPDEAPKAVDKGAQALATMGIS